MNNSQINYQGRNPLPATPFCASHFVSCETENMYFWTDSNIFVSIKKVLKCVWEC